MDTCPDGGQMRFHVTDTGPGPGIPASLHGVIFEKFSQGHALISCQHGGTGLGLSRALAELLGGTLTARSVVGEGSTFTLSLPLQPPTQAAALPAQTRAPPGRRPLGRARTASRRDFFRERGCAVSYTFTGCWKSSRVST